MCESCDNMAAAFAGGSDDQISYEITVNVPEVGQQTKFFEGFSAEHAAFVAGVISACAALAESPMGSLLMPLMATTVASARQCTVWVKEAVTDNDITFFLDSLIGPQDNNTL